MTEKGVAFAPPPRAMLPDITASIARAASGLAVGEGAVVGIATDAGWNGAVVVRAPHGIDVHAWVGKSWGTQLTGGVEVRKTFRVF